MAQKRNPISLRLQTRLKGYEKHFASCWFTDSFLSQVCINDLLLRLYCGHILQKGGSWYGEVSESRVPESCISLQFLYRRCFVFSVILDKRKEEYTILNVGAQSRRESISVSSQAENSLAYITTREETGKHYNHNVSGLTKRDNCSKCEDKIPVSTYSKVCKFSDRTMYSVMSNVFTGIVAQYKHNSSPSSNKGMVSPFSQREKLLHLESKEHKKDFLEYNVDQGSLSFSLIESICNLHQEKKGENDSLLYHKVFCNTQANSDNQLFVERRQGGYKQSLQIPRFASQKSIAVKECNDEEKMTMSFSPPIHWTSINLIRGVASCQSVEFCLHSVALLYSQRLSFLKIKETIFKRLASNPNVRGARLVCSGRQGGRSKSAMRAKKQCAILGRSALSLFSSRLAFASTNIDTTFGQIGIKLWICYK